MSDESATATFLFTDIEGSTRLWEREPGPMRLALARHDALSRQAVAAHRGQLVKSTGDGIHAVFDDAADALHAVLALLQALAETPAGEPVLKIRCGLHLGTAQRRDGDYFGPVLNRAARIMAAAHGGQVLVSQAVADAVAGRLPARAALRALGAVRLRDLDEPLPVHQLLHPALREAFPPLRALAEVPTNLPQPLNSFVGRERELAELRARLPQTRLLTLLGMGGIGKSRLSLQLAATVLDDHPDGVWLVELAPLTDPLRVPQALASVLGVKEEAGRSVTEALLAWVRDRRLLVILDNCEHLLTACAELAKQLLQAGPGVRVLASSRDVLQVAGETVYPVPTLSVPEAGGTDLEALSRHEAVRLFVDRARAVQPALAIDSAAQAAAVVAICRALDGIPLALELAAARTRALPLPAIAERLGDRFRLLVSTDQTVLPRQRTLRALIDWSHDLLSEPERVLFRRLAVFAGGCTLDAAEAVAADETLPGTDVLDLLARLVDKSLLAMSPDGARYRMLETVRAYAAEQLAAAGDEAATRRRHVGHFVQLAASSQRQRVGPEQAQWLQRLDAERDNLLSAHDWCGRDASCHDAGLQLVFLLKTYWLTRGLLGLGHRVTVEALGRTQPDERSLGRCRVLCDAGQLCWFMGRHDEARRYLEESRDLAHALGDAGRIAAVMQPLGLTYLALGDRSAAQSLYEATVAMARQSGNRRAELVAGNSLAQLHRAAGRLAEAESLFASVIAIARELGDRESVAIGLLNQSMALISRGDTAAARPLLDEVRDIAAAVGSQPVAQSLLEVSAGLAAAEGDARRAAELFGAAEARSARTGIRRDANDEAFLQPLLQRARERLGADAFAAAQALGRDAA